MQDGQCLHEVYSGLSWYMQCMRCMTKRHGMVLPCRRYSAANE